MTNGTGVVRGEVRVAGFRRVSHGLYRQALPSGASADDEQLQDLLAWGAVLPEDAVFTHVTAAWLNGWWMPRLPEQVPVFAAIGRSGSHPRRSGLVCSRLERSATPTVAAGFPVDAPGEVLLRAARDLSFLDLTVMLDSALRQGGAQVLGQVDDLCRGSRPGVKRLRASREVADPRSESAWETILRMFYVSVGVEVEPQKEIFDADGSFVARADLWVVGTKTVAEYDGGEHLRVPRQRRDLRRARRLDDVGLSRRGYVADDLLGQPLVMLSEIDRVVGRPHVPGRLRTWRHWLSESTYTSEGRRRLQNRWFRRTGTPDWARTA